MREFIKSKLSKLGHINEASMEHMMDYFINCIKPEFDGYESHYLDLSATVGLRSLTDPNIGLDNGTLYITAQELRDYVFEPVIREVLLLIEIQFVQCPYLEAIFLVGGFGQSIYLQRRVEEVYANRVGLVRVPPRGELAVVRGAVYFGLNPQTVTERVSRRTYGLESRMPFDPSLDPPENAVMVDQKKFCRQRFSVFVKRGQSVKVNECFMKTYGITYRNDTDSDLYTYDEDGEPPRLTTHPLVKKVGHFPIRMPRLNGVKDGAKVLMTIKMYFGLTEIQIECIIQDTVTIFTSAFDASDMNHHNARQSMSIDSPRCSMYGANPRHGSMSSSYHSYPSPYTAGPVAPTLVIVPEYQTAYPPGHFKPHTSSPRYSQTPDYYQQYQQGYPPPSQTYYSGNPPGPMQTYPPHTGPYYGPQ